MNHTTQISLSLKGLVNLCKGEAQRGIWERGVNAQSVFVSRLAAAMNEGGVWGIYSPPPKSNRYVLWRSWPDHPAVTHRIIRRETETSGTSTSDDPVPIGSSGTWPDHPVQMCREAFWLEFKCFIVTLMGCFHLKICTWPALINQRCPP